MGYWKQLHLVAILSFVSLFVSIFVKLVPLCKTIRNSCLDLKLHYFN